MIESLSNVIKVHTQQPGRRTKKVRKQLPLWISQLPAMSNSCWQQKLMSAAAVYNYSDAVTMMDSKNRSSSSNSSSKNLDSTATVKYLHPFSSPNPSPHNGHHGRGQGQDHPGEIRYLSTPDNKTPPGLPDYFDAADSAFKKIKLLQESSLDHHPTSVSCPTPARRRHRTTFTQVSSAF